MAATQQPVIWKKRILVPFWIVRICVMIFIIGVYAWTLRNLDDLNDIEDVVRPAVASVVIFMLLIVAVLLLDVLAIVLFLRDALKPGTFLTMNCFQTAFWGGVLVMDIVATIRHQTSAVGVAFTVGVFLTFVGLLIYAIINNSRAKKTAQRGNYAPAHNPAMPTPPAYPQQYQGAPPYQQNTAYHPQTSTNVELHNQYLPPYQGGAATDYYSQQPTKPANMV